MNSKGIRIPDKKNHVICVTLSNILDEINNGNSLYWSVLFLEASGDFEDAISTPLNEEQIRMSEKGLFLTWLDLNILSKKIDQTIWLTLIGCKNKNNACRYKEDQDMYETCDITIEMIDSWYWEVFSKDETLINRLAAKFENTKFLESNFEK